MAGEPVVPRHRLIVAAIVGDAAATTVTRLIGAAEALMGLWILSGVRPRTCAAVQTLAKATMNVIEQWSAAPSRRGGGSLRRMRGVAG